MVAHGIDRAPGEQFLIERLSLAIVLVEQAVVNQLWADGIEDDVRNMGSLGMYMLCELPLCDLCQIL